MIGSKSPCSINALIRIELSCRLPELSISACGVRVASASNYLDQQRNSLRNSCEPNHSRII